MAKQGKDTNIRWLKTLTSGDVPLVGGKNASLGEMIKHLHRSGIRVPDGFATTARAYYEFLGANDLTGKITGKLDQYHSGRLSLAKAGAAIRRLIMDASCPPPSPWRPPRPTASSAGAPGGATRTWRCAAAPPPKTCRMPASPASRRRFSTYAVTKACSRPAAAAMPPCSPTGPSATGRTTASIT